MEAAEGSPGIRGGGCGGQCSLSLSSPQGPPIIETVLEMIAFDDHSASSRPRAPDTAPTLQTRGCLLTPITVCIETFASAKGPNVRFDQKKERSTAPLDSSFFFYS